MNKASNRSWGAELQRRFHNGRLQADRAPLPGARNLAVLKGVDPSGNFYRPMNNVLLETRDLLCASERVFQYGHDICINVAIGPEQYLRLLRCGENVESSAGSRLANLFICESGPTAKESLPLQYPPPPKFVSTLMFDDQVLSALPKIQYYARRPVFDRHFQLRGPGWHAETGVLVHGEAIEVENPPSLNEDVKGLDRLPASLRSLLQDFCFKSNADLANALAAFLTGFLVNHFMDNPKPVILVDGNQSGVGKSLLINSLGVVLDGVCPHFINFTSDDNELQKQICATLRSENQSILLFDNAKTPSSRGINSQVLEANCLAPTISLRVLGKSENYTRANDVLWAITMNETKTSPDLVSRGLPIRLYYEGDPRQRPLNERDPLQYARDNRQQILAEIIMMVVRWLQAGRPAGQYQHRCSHWATIIGGILDCNGFPEFLSNLDEAMGQFDAALDEISRLAETALQRSEAGFFRRLDSDLGHTALAWLPLFESARLLSDKLAASRHSQATTIGNFLAKYQNREVVVQRNDQPVKVKLVMKNGAAHKKLYCFELSENNTKPATGTSSHPSTEVSGDRMDLPRESNFDSFYEPNDAPSPGFLVEATANPEPWHKQPGGLAQMNL